MVPQASTGDTILYTYQITNTGNVTLTVTANDDQLGNVTGLAGVLAPLATQSATLTYTVQASDPAGNLVNTVTVTGTDSLDTPVVVSDTAVVVISAPTNLPAGEQPTQHREIYLPHVEN